MTAHPPPVPPDQRSDKGSPISDKGPAQPTPQDRNLAEQGRQGDIKQNTTNKGYQQDR